MSDLATLSDTQKDLQYVRQDMLLAEPPPSGVIGPWAWMRKNLFSGIGHAVLTLIGIGILALLIPPLIKFTIIDAVWTGSDRDACLDDKVGRAVGACWPFINAKFGQLVYGFYPIEQRWRVNIVYALGIILLVPLMIPKIPFKRLNAVLFFLVFPIVAFYLLVGGRFGLTHVETRSWGGLLVTLVVAVTGIVASLPLGVVLALGRRSKMPIVKTVSVIFIEFVRGVPLITVLFFATYMLPLFLPRSWEVDNLLRALIGVALFSAAYMAEVIRGGLQAIPKGQYEGAMAVGLGYWKMMGLIVMPQALKLVIPGIVNSFIGLFKDTTLVMIVSILDLLGVLRASFTDPNWATPVTLYTGFAFAGIIYFVFCFGMSRYSLFLERYLNTSHRR